MYTGWWEGSRKVEIKQKIGKQLKQAMRGGIPPTSCKSKKKIFADLLLGCHCDCDSFHCDCDSVTILTLATATNAQNSSKNAKGTVDSQPGKRNNVPGTLALELKFPKGRSFVQKKSNNVVQLVSCSEVFLDGILGAQVKPQERKITFFCMCPIIRRLATHCLS